MKFFKFNLKLKQKLLIFFLLFSIIPSSVITFIALTSDQNNVNSSKNEMISMQEKALSSLGEKYSDVVNSWVFDQSKSVSSYALDSSLRSQVVFLSNPSDRNSSLLAIDHFFSTLENNTPSIAELFLVNYTSGTILLSKANSHGGNTLDYYILTDLVSGAKATQGINAQVDTPYFKEPYYSTLTGTYNMAFSQVVRSSAADSMAPKEILIVVKDTSALWNLIAPRDNHNKPVDNFYSTNDLGSTGEIFLIDSAGIAISPSRFILANDNFVLKENFSTLNDFKIALITGHSLGIGKNYNGHSVYRVFEYIGFHPLGNDSRNSYLIQRLSFDLNWVLSIEIDQSQILSPITTLQNQQTVSLFFIIGIILAIGVIVTIFSFYIASSISKPVSNLSELSRTISEGDLTIHIEPSEKTDEISVLQNSFLQMIIFLRTIILSVSDTANTISSSAQEMASSSEEVNASSEEMASVSQQISKGAQQQTEYLTASMIQMEEFNKKISENLTNVQATSSLIEKISGQVNMLALNASIEAARAGEYGRGFAVVADNIRRLADETKDSVYKVTTIIEQLSTSTKKGIDSFNSQLENVLTVAEETSSGAEESSAATEEQAATMEELSASAQELAKISNDLRNIVSRFKLN